MCRVCGIDECDDDFWCLIENEIQEYGTWCIGDDDDEDFAAQQSVQRTCANCGADDWRDAIIPDTVEICNRCGASR